MFCDAAPYGTFDIKQFIHYLFYKYLSNTHYELGTVQGAKKKMETKTILHSCMT